jgi:hypothetical protein
MSATDRSVARKSRGIVSVYQLRGGNTPTLPTTGSGVKPAVTGSERTLVDALQECIAALRLATRVPPRDLQNEPAVRALGERIGYGALMATASDVWRQRLAEDGAPVGGEFVCGPCRSTAALALAAAEAALAQISGAA